MPGHAAGSCADDERSAVGSFRHRRYGTPASHPPMLDRLPRLGSWTDSRRFTGARAYSRSKARRSEGPARVDGLSVPRAAHLPGRRYRAARVRTGLGLRCGASDRGRVAHRPHARGRRTRAQVAGSGESGGRSAPSERAATCEGARRPARETRRGPSVDDPPFDRCRTRGARTGGLPTGKTVEPSPGARSRAVTCARPTPCLPRPS